MQLVLDTNGLQVKVRNKCFWIVGKKQRRQISPRRIRSVLIAADCMVSSAAVRLAARNGIPIFWENGQGKTEARMWSPGFGSHALIRKHQALWSKQPKATRWIIAQFRLRMEGQVQLIRQLINRRPALQTSGQDCIAKLERLQRQLESITPKTTVEDARARMLGLEGTGARAYWGFLGGALPRDWTFRHRSRRPAKDPFNAALNYGYGMLYRQIENAAFAAGLDPYMGIFHADEYRRPALVFDLIEPFRPWVDQFIVELVHHKRLSNQHFKEVKGGLWMGKEGRRVLIPAFFEKWEETKRFRHRDLSRKTHIYRYTGELARMLEKAML